MAVDFNLKIKIKKALSHSENLEGAFIYFKMKKYSDHI